MSLAGDFKEIPFSDVVQLYSQTRKTAVLVVRAPRSGEELGYFYFERGELYDAKLGDAEGLEAVYRGLELEEGTFQVLGDVRTPQRRIFKPVGAMLREGIRRLEASGRKVPRPATGQLELVRPPTGQEAQHAGVEEARSGELGGKICPSCHKRFIHGEVCPDDGAALEDVPADAERADLTPPAGTALPAGTGQRPGLRAPRVWWVAFGGGAVIVAVLAVVWLSRSGVLASAKAPPPPAPAATSQASAAPVRAIATEALAATVRGVTEKEIAFGMAGPLSGATKELGRQMKLGIETAFHLTNDQGGVHGRRLRLVALDDGYEPTRTAVAMKELYENARVFAVVGNVGTPTAAVAVPYSLERKMLFYGAFTGASLLRRDPPDRYVINYRASYAEETAAVVNYLVKVRRIRPSQIAVFAQRDSYGDAGFAGVSRAMRGLRTDAGKVLRVGYARNTVEVAEAVRVLMEHPIPIRAVVMVGTYRACAKFIEKVRDFVPRMIFTNVSFVGSTALAGELALLGPKYAEGVIVTQVVPPVDGHSTAVLRYKAALEKYFPGEAPDYVSLEGYLASMVLVEALRRSGRDFDTERLIDAFERIQNLEIGTGAPVSFGLAEHQGSHRVWGTQLDEQGRYQDLDLD